MQALWALSVSASSEFLRTGWARLYSFQMVETRQPLLRPNSKSMGMSQPNSFGLLPSTIGLFVMPLPNQAVPIQRQRLFARRCVASTHTEYGVRLARAIVLCPACPALRNTSAAVVIDNIAFEPLCRSLRRDAEGVIAHQDGYSLTCVSLHQPLMTFSASRVFRPCQAPTPASRPHLRPATPFRI